MLSSKSDELMDEKTTGCLLRALHTGTPRDIKQIAVFYKGDISHKYKNTARTRLSIKANEWFDWEKEPVIFLSVPFTDPLTELYKFMKK